MAVLLRLLRMLHQQDSSLRSHPVAHALIDKLYRVFSRCVRVFIG